MKNLDQLFKNNKNWVDRITKEDPNFFQKLAKQQSPEILWIGCADSRVPANEIVGMLPGELFVHRNVANQVIHTDLNCLAVIQYAVEVLKVKHVIVCGHYNCGGVNAALDNKRLGLIDNWLRHIVDVREKHHQLFNESLTYEEKSNLLTKLNVIEQVSNLAHTTIVTEAWERNQDITIHGVVYKISDGILKDIGISTSSLEELREVYGKCLAELG